MSEFRRGWRPDREIQMQPDRTPGRRSRFSAVLLLMLGWTALCGFALLFAPPSLDWLQAITATVIDNSREVARALGGEAAGELVGALQSSDLVGRLFGAANILATPAIIVVWLVGMLGLTMLRRLIGLTRSLSTRRT